jgi:hypothetical protein
MTTATGWRKGQINVLMAGRQTGKSTFMDIANPPAIRILDSATVDGETWYTVQCKHYLVAKWVLQQDPDMWHRHEHIDKQWDMHFNVFDMHEKLYTMLILKWK